MCILLTSIMHHFSVPWRLCARLVVLERPRLLLSITVFVGSRTQPFVLACIRAPFECRMPVHKRMVGLALTMRSVPTCSEAVAHMQGVYVRGKACRPTKGSGRRREARDSQRADTSCLRTIQTQRRRLMSTGHAFRSPARRYFEGSIQNWVGFPA